MDFKPPYPPSNLVEACEPLFLLMNRIQTPAASVDVAAMRTSLQEGIAQMEKTAKSLNYGAEEIELARYALIVAFDEIILCSAWEGKEEWSHEPMQLTCFGDNTGGIAFFEKLEMVRAKREESPELLEIYFLCMALGFKGKYRLLNRENLQSLKRNILAELKQTPGLETDLSPEWSQPVTPAKSGKKSLPAWMIPALCGGMAICLFFVLSFVGSSSVHRLIRDLMQ